MNKSIELYQVDSFTREPFAGNPAAVCLLDDPRSENWMQSVAREMNLSETAFLHRRDDENSFDLRWFTPAAEVSLCGHATLASAHALWEAGRAKRENAIQFHTLSGELVAESNGELIELNFPALPPSPCDPPADLLKAVGVTPVFAGKNDLDYLLELKNEQAVVEAMPDFARLATIEARGVMITAGSTKPDCDFVSRHFAPSQGIDEDPVTGSAHCCLGPFWSQKLNRSELTGYQASPRGGFVRVKVLGDRVQLGGHAITVFHAELRC